MELKSNELLTSMWYLTAPVRVAGMDSGQEVLASLAAARRLLRVNVVFVGVWSIVSGDVFEWDCCVWILKMCWSGVAVRGSCHNTSCTAHLHTRQTARPTAQELLHSSPIRDWIVAVDEFEKGEGASSAHAAPDLAVRLSGVWLC